jgi:hypothetical protein
MIREKFSKQLSPFHSTALIYDSGTAGWNAKLYRISLTDYLTIATFQTFPHVDNNGLLIFDFKNVSTADGNTVTAPGAFFLVNEDEIFRYFVPCAHNTLP